MKTFMFLCGDGHYKEQPTTPTIDNPHFPKQMSRRQIMERKIRWNLNKYSPILVFSAQPILLLGSSPFGHVGIFLEIILVSIFNASV